MSVQMSDQGPKLSEADLAHFEHSLGRPMPREYREFLRLHNGGQPNPSSVPLGESGARADIQSFFGIGMDEPTENIDNVVHAFGNRLPDNFYPIAQDPGGNLIGIMETGSNAGAVLYWDLDLEGEGDAVSVIAPNFHSFISGLSSTGPNS